MEYATIFWDRQNQILCFADVEWKLWLYIGFEPVREDIKNEMCILDYCDTFKLENVFLVLCKKHETDD